MAVNQFVSNKVSETISNLLEAGVSPWEKPWFMLSNGKQYADDEIAKYFAVNYVNNIVYEFVNQLMLRPGYYVTFKQANDLGGHIRKGSKASWVVGYFKAADEVEEDKQSILEEKYGNGPYPAPYVRKGDKIFYEYLACRMVQVFHLDDVEGYRTITHTKRVNKCKATMVEGFTIDNAEDVIAEYIQRDGVGFTNIAQNQAYYSPATHSVVVPTKEQFGEKKEEYYSTVFHELGHSTGKKLGRKVENHFGDQLYSKEELVAEGCAMMCLQALNINTNNTEANSVAYLKSWGEHIRNDKVLKDNILIALNQSLQAYKYIFGLLEEEKGI